MKRVPSPYELEQQAQEMGERIGDIIVKIRDEPILDVPETSLYSSGFNTTRYLDFLQDEKLRATHVQSARVFEAFLQAYPTVRYLDNHFVTEQLHAVDDDRKRRQRVSLIGAPLLGYAGAELITSSPLEGTAGLVIGGMFAAIHRRVEERKQRSAISSELEAIGQALQSPDKVISLAAYVPPRVDLPKFYESLTEKLVTSTGVQFEYGIADVLEWVRANTKPAELHSNYRDDSLKAYYNTDIGLDSSGIVVQTDTSLWELFEKTQHTSSLRTASDVAFAARGFQQARTKLANQTGLELEPADPNFARKIFMSNKKDLLELNGEFRAKWLDARCSYIQIPPGLLVYQLLQQSKDPTALWAEIAPRMRAIENNQEEQEMMGKKLADMHHLQIHANVISITGREERFLLREELAAAQEATLFQVLSIAAVAMRLDRISRYETMREELLQSMGNVSQAGDQLGAIKLFDAGINALIQNTEPDSQEAIELGRGIMLYLQGAMRHVDGSAEAYKQIYEGMQKHFPQLNIQ